MSIPYLPSPLADHMGQKLLAPVGMFLSIIALVALCAKPSGRIKRSLDRLPTSSTLPAARKPAQVYHLPKQLLALNGNHKDPIQTASSKGKGKEAMEEYGEGGVWQRSILMGEKCQPPEFSGAIYYDSQGNQLPEPPTRSPRASPLPSNYYFYVADVQKSPK
ncbi:hypothetical protein SAY86_013779 [Trapa natans]|uniref:Transmembrane protein n=1 Tax=Trapa natans TaxID=22666 RepID=A0AAN7KV67_TRANT|nr:hypothetical protein SAY86_013779 [Trapa natans]